MFLKFSGKVCVTGRCCFNTVTKFVIRIAKHVMLAAMERAKVTEIKLNDRGTEMVPGFGIKRDYRRDF